MNSIPKNLIGQSGEHFVQSMLLREGITCSSGENEVDIVVRLTKPKRQFWILVVSNLQPKKAGGQGKQALDWWIPFQNNVDFIACVDLSTLRAWIFDNNELAKLAQQRTSGKFHLYMYTDKAVALRGQKSMKFDYEFEGYRIENRIYRGIFEKKGRKIIPKSRIKIKDALKAKAKTKTKVKEAAKRKARTKTKAKARTKIKAKARARTKTKAKTKARIGTKTKVKAKTRVKTPARG